jgi:phosphoribosyl 1,2-cyclic phosphodiesterase
MKVKIWGTRGSIPSPGPHTVKYGGNTICLEFRFEPDNRLIILDAGSGIRHLGMELMQTEIPKGPLKLDLFFSHTHWDHILGFPFFIPIYVPTTELNIYGPVTFEDDPLKRWSAARCSTAIFRLPPLSSAQN